jgi:hypothetical protein
MEMPMTERGLLFTPENYTKVEAGTKTQTRRIVKHPDHYACLTGDCPHEDRGLCAAEMPVHCPYGTVGDRLYVKEGLEKDGQYIRYRRGLPERVISPDRVYPMWKWKKNHLSPLHMPKWAARLWLEIVEVRVERLQDISHEDVIAEGYSNAVNNPEFFMPGWEKIHGQGSWALNPWVWVLAFRKVAP